MSSPPAVSSYPGYFHASVEELIKTLREKERAENLEQTACSGCFHTSIEDLKKLGKNNEGESIEQESSSDSKYPSYFLDRKEELKKISSQEVERCAALPPESEGRSSALESLIGKVKSMSAVLNLKNSPFQMIALATFSAAIIAAPIGYDLEAGLFVATCATASAYVGEQIKIYLQKKHD
jgi:hypothetical protein